MKATIRATNEVINAKNLNDLAAVLGGKISASGFRALKAVTEKGAEVCQSLYDGESYIKASNGRLIAKW